MAEGRRNRGDKARIKGDKLKESVDNLLQRDQLDNDKAHAGDKPAAGKQPAGSKTVKKELRD